MNETEALRLFLLLGSRAGARLFRNNVGTAYRKDGTPVRFGLCKGSSDIIGWVPVTITPEHVGLRIALFVALEGKSPKRGKATKTQENFLSKVAESGGLAILSREPDATADIIRQASGGEIVFGRVHRQMSRTR
jgi:hypothetical protein